MTFVRLNKWWVREALARRAVSGGSITMDRDVETSVSGMTFETTSVERLFATPVPPVARRRFGALVVACLLVHASMVAVLVHENGFFPQLASTAQEIPVEVVIEPPPPPDQVPPPAPKETLPKVENTLDEAPAVDAPRAANDEKIERNAPDAVSQTPHVAPPSTEVAPTPVPESKPAPAPEAASQAAPAPLAAAPAETKPDAEAIERAEVKRDEPQEAEARAATQAQPEKGEKSVADLLANLEPLPDYQVGSAARSAPVTGGKAKTTYLSILYGLIMPHLHVPPRVGGSPSPAEGEIAFNIDGKGKLTYQEVRHSSGVQDLDAAAVAAIRQASPFPRPPNGLPLGLTFVYTANK
jgi:protein TonB